MSDSVRLEQLGVPTVTFVTGPFEAAARATARALGLADLALIVLPHDYLAATEAGMADVAASHVDDVVAALFGD